MIIGFDYQTEDVVAEELDKLMKLKPTLSQFMIYGPVPGTPFYERIIKENLLHDVYIKDPELFYRRGDGFTTMIKHPTLSPDQIEKIQRWCFKQDFERLGPSIIRVQETRLLGYQKLKNSTKSLSAREGEVLRQGIAEVPIPCISREGCSDRMQRSAAGSAILQRRIHAELGYPTLAERFKSVLAVGAALWTGLTLKLDLFQHPKLVRTTYRLPGKSWHAFHLWEDIPHKISIPELSIQSRPPACKEAGVAATGGRSLGY